MRKFMKLGLAAGAGAFEVASVGLHATQAADMGYPQEQYEGPPPQAYVPPPQAYGPPPVEESYSYPPPVALRRSTAANRLLRIWSALCGRARTLLRARAILAWLPAALRLWLWPLGPWLPPLVSEGAAGTGKAVGPGINAVAFGKYGVALVALSR
jgi:hypothetical protein